ncbi:hypothetical protein AB7M49_004028 [Bradyrhizobium elkanii]
MGMHTGVSIHVQSLDVDFVNELRSMNVTPHVAQNASGRSSAIDGRTTRRGGFAVSQRTRKRIRGGIRLDQDDRRVRV